MPPSAPPDPFDHDDLIAYLQAWMTWKQGVNPRYSHRRFAMDCGHNSPGALANVFNGNRFPTEALLLTFIPALKLNEHPLAAVAEESELMDEPMVEFLLLLRDHGGAAREEARLQEAHDALLAETQGAHDLASRRRRESSGHLLWRAREETAARLLKLKAARAQRSFAPLEREGYRVLSTWYYPVIVELTRCAGFAWDGAWISAALGGAITAQDAEAALTDLESIGALLRAEHGVERAAPSAVTPKTVQAIAVSQYYEGVYERCGRSLRRLLTPGEMEYNRRCRLGGLTVAIPSPAIVRVHELLQGFQTQLLAELEAFDETPDAVYQVYLHVFPVTDVITPPAAG